MSAGSWAVYILRCADGTLYTGIAPDVEKRVQKHNEGKGAKYTRGRTPVELVYQEELGDKSAALRREASIKKMSRTEKLALIRTVPETSNRNAEAPPEDIP